VECKQSFQRSVHGNVLNILKKHFR
jgi:hypothetical protein